MSQQRISKDDVLAAMAGRFADFYSRYVVLKSNGGEHRGPCPIHNGQRDSFTVDTATGRYCCHSKCAVGGDVFDFLSRIEGLDFPDALDALARWSGTASLTPSPSPVKRNNLIKPSRHMVANYDYTDENGTLLFQVVRYEPKGFSQRRPAEGGKWVYSISGVRRVLYRLPEVLAAVRAGRPVYICEGEKDADALAALGLAATTAPMGAMKKPEQWEDAYTEALCSAGVVLLPDNDTAGRDHAQIVAQALYRRAKRVRIVQLPGLLEKGDVSDWLAAGGSASVLLQLARDAPDWVPAPAPVAAELTVLPSTDSAPIRTALIMDENPWPVASSEIFYGLAGDIVRVLEPHTEADPVALLVQLLSAFGSAIGRSSYFMAEADQHFGNLFMVIVGISSKGRKGTSWGQIRRLFAQAEPQWEATCLQSGLSSGEGLVWHVRDPIEALKKNRTTGELESEVVDPGVTDKRLLVMESEYASVLRVAGRDGNTLSAILRDAWDRGCLQTMTKTNPAKATGAHVSVIGHVTADELRRELTSTEAGNGFANRFLWVCARRSKELPEGGNLDDHDLHSLALRLSAAIQNGRGTGLMARDDAARTLWRAVYHDLSEGGPGLAGAVTSRSEAQVMRLALLYAVLDEASAIRREHLTAALALWEYVEASAKYIFGDSMGDPIADDILRTLRAAPNGMSRTDFRDLFGRNQSSGRIGQALALLLKYGRARVVEEQTGGRPAERWYITEPDALAGRNTNDEKIK